MFTHPEIWSFASNWYRYLDVHAPLGSFRPLLTEDVQLVFPEATVTGFEGYSSWYNKVIDIFFDEQHTLKIADITSQSDQAAEVHVVVNSSLEINMRLEQGLTFSINTNTLQFYMVSIVLQSVL